MGQEKRDFDFTVKLFDNFFKRKKIQKKFKKFTKLKELHDIEITGWETWWQVEFALYLLNKDDTVSWWEREWRYPIDKRVSSKRKNEMSIDFLVRQKHAKVGQYIALELKQDINAKTCIKGMLEDIDKVYSMKQSASDIRSYWNIGIYKYSKDKGDEKGMIKEMILGYAGLSTSEEFIKIFQIGNTEFHYVIF
jgi:hypothetical protein